MKPRLSTTSTTIAIIASLAVTLLLAGAALAADIKIGVLSDLSGPTSDVGPDYAQGIKDCAEWINAKGGIKGQKIELIQVDYAYNVQQALAAYKRFLGQGIVALQGWGTGDTEALVKFVAQDKIPTFSASYSAHLMDPEKAPYNFTVSADYSTQLRAALKYLKDNWKEGRAPKIAFIYPNHPYGLTPIPAAKEYAKEIGYEIVGDEIVDLKAMDATTQLLSLQKSAPDFAWIGGTISSTAVIMKDAQKLKLPTKFVTNVWGADENLLKLAGPAVAGHYTLQPAAVYGQDVQGMKVIKEITKNQPRMTHYIRGFASMYVMAEGIRLAAEKGKIDGPSIKEALEGMRDFDPMGLTPPVSFFPKDHRPSMSVNIYRLDEGKMTFLTTQSMERKAEWLGK